MNWPVTEPAPAPSPLLSQVLEAATQRFREAGLPEPRREAWWLWTGMFQVSRTEAWLGRSDPVDPAAATRFEEAVSRRLMGEPLPYVTGIAEFRSLTLRCDRRALIPRPETEGLVDLVLERAPGGTLIDVGTGTGCLALALAAEGRYRLVVGTDRSPGALELAAENRARTGLPVRLTRGDLLEPFKATTADVVVSNPPYLAAREYETLADSVRHWEPAEALRGGPDGLGVTGRLVAEARRVVRPDGWLALEVDAGRAAEVARAAGQGGWREVTVHQDLFGRARYVLARRNEAE